MEAISSTIIIKITIITICAAVFFHESEQDKFCSISHGGCAILWTMGSMELCISQLFYCLRDFLKVPYGRKKFSSLKLFLLFILQILL